MSSPEKTLLKRYRTALRLSAGLSLRLLPYDEFSGEIPCIELYIAGSKVGTCQVTLELKKLAPGKVKFFSSCLDRFVIEGAGAPERLADVQVVGEFALTIIRAEVTSEMKLFQGALNLKNCKLVSFPTVQYSLVDISVYLMSHLNIQNCDVQRTFNFKHSCQVLNLVGKAEDLRCLSSAMVYYLTAELKKEAQMSLLPLMNMREARYLNIRPLHEAALAAELIMSLKQKGLSAVEVQEELIQVGYERFA